MDGAELFYVYAMTVRLALNVMYLSMFVYGILSWFVLPDTPVMMVLSCITAPVVIPVRAVLSRIPALQRLPIDISFIVAFVLLILVMTFLPPIT